MKRVFVIFVITAVVFLIVFFSLTGHQGNNDRPGNMCCVPANGAQYMQGEESWIVKDTGKLIENLLHSKPGLFQHILDSAGQFEVQVIYTQIERDARQRPFFRQFSYRLNDRQYFNPASLVKLPMMLMALEKLNKLNIPGLNKYSRMETDSAFFCQDRVLVDKQLDNAIPSIAHYCKKMMLVSDNESYNRAYEFLGQKYMNERLWQMGYPKALIIQRFNNCTYEYNKYTNPVKFYGPQGNLLYSQPLLVNPRYFRSPLGEVKKGKAYMNGKDLVLEPIDFTYSNNLSLQDLHDILLSLVFPEALPEKKKFLLTESDYRFMYKYMSLYPRESEFRFYHKQAWFPDNLKKYFLWGSTSPQIDNNGLRSFNVAGQSQGYLSDCAYIVDFENNIEFVLLATIFTNQSGVFNQPNYRYRSIGFPFLENLGKTFYNYELKRKRTYQPSLTKLHELLN